MSIVPADMIILETLFRFRYISENLESRVPSVVSIPCITTRTLRDSQYLG